MIGVNVLVVCVVCLVEFLENVDIFYFWKCKVFCEVVFFFLNS